MRFRTKLALSYLFLIALIIGSFYLYSSSTLQNGIIEESRSNLANQAKLASLLVISNKGVQPSQQLAEMVGAAIKSRVTLIAPDGTVIGDSEFLMNCGHRLQSLRVMPKPFWTVPWSLIPSGHFVSWRLSPVTRIVLPT